MVPHTVTQPPDTGTGFAPGDRFLLPAGNGKVVRTGSIIEWVPPTGLVGHGQWFVQIDPDPDLPCDGYRTWFRSDRLLPTTATAEEIAAYVAARQVEWFGPGKLQRAAAKLVVGDRIAAGFLPQSQAATVVFVLPYTALGEDWVFVAYQFDDGIPDREDFRAAGLVPLEASGDASGMGYGRTAGTGEAVAGAVPAGVDGHAQGRAAHATGPACPGAAAGFEADCGTAGPHGPHPFGRPAGDMSLPELAYIAPMGDGGLAPAPIAAHYETDHRVGIAPSTSSVDCACGGIFSGDTLADAVALLERHIAEANAALTPASAE